MTPPFPPGDPAAMRTAAQSLRNLARTVGLAAQAGGTTASDPGFTGPKADVFVGEMVGWRSGLEDSAERLTETATWLVGEAERLHDRQEAWRQAREREQERLAERLR